MRSSSVVEGRKTARALIDCSLPRGNSCAKTTEHCLRESSGVYYRSVDDQKGKCRVEIQAGRLFADREAFSFPLGC